MRTTIITLKVSRLHEGVSLPKYETEGAAGLDVRAFLDGNLTLEPSSRTKIPTGLKVQVPEGFELQVRPRSGLAFSRGITVLNSPGTIDSDYRGEVAVLLVNLGPETFTVKNGDRIAQLVLVPVFRAEIQEVAEEELSPTDRGSGGFGSTG